MRAFTTWQAYDSTGRKTQISVETFKGKAEPGETVPPDETTDAWKARHEARVTQALATWPPIQ